MRDDIIKYVMAFALLYRQADSSIPEIYTHTRRVYRYFCEIR